MTLDKRPHFSIVIDPLFLEDGGGFVVTVPDLRGCMSDGETEFEAIWNARDAIDCRLQAAAEEHRPVPTSSYYPRRIAG